LKLFNEKVAQIFWFDVFVDEVMLNIVVCEYEYFEKICNFEERLLLRAKIGDTLDIIQSRMLRLSDRRTIQDTPTQQKNGTNYIVSYDLYNRDALISRPIFGNIAMSEVLYSKNKIIPKLIARFIENLKNRFDEKNLVLFFDYALSKATSRYRKKFIEEVFKK